MVRLFCVYIVLIKRTQYGLYQDAVSLCKTTNETKWQKAIFWVFDSPEIAQKPIEVCLFFPFLSLI